LAPFIIRFLQDTAASSFVAPISRPDPKNVAFGLQPLGDNGTVFALATGKATAVTEGEGIGGMRLSVTITREEPAPERYPTVEAAEDRIFADILATVPVSETISTDGIDAQAVNAIRINRAANLIAARTRRGAGNVVLLHADDLSLFSLFQCKSASFAPAGSARTIGRWTEAGSLNNCIAVWTTTALPASIARGTAVVCYRGTSETDCAAFIAEDGDAFGVVIKDASTYRLAASSDYFGVVTLVSAAQTA
jgi:hypothetical protein